MPWKKMDDDAVANYRTWGALATERLISNLGFTVGGRLQSGTYTHPFILEREENVLPNLTSREWKLGGVREKVVMLPWAPRDGITTLKLELMYEILTNPGVNVSVYLLTDRGPVRVSDSPAIVNLGPTGGVNPAIYTWTIDLSPVQQGGANPYVVNLLLQVESELSTDPGDVRTFSLPGNAANYDYRGVPSSVIIAYGRNWTYVSNNTAVREIDHWQITNIIYQDTAKGLLFGTQPLAQGGPYEVILQMESPQTGLHCVRWFPMMDDVPYFDRVDSLEITRLGELTVRSIRIQDVAGRPKGPVRNTGAMTRSLSGGRAARGPEHVQVWKQFDYYAYEYTPVHHWGPQVLPKAAYVPPYTPVGSPAVQSDDMVCSAASTQYVNTLWRIVNEWRVSDHMTFSGDLVLSERRTVEILPMWVLLCRDKDPEEFPIQFRLTNIRTDNVVDGQEVYSRNIVPYSSEYTRHGWASENTPDFYSVVLRTCYSSNCLWLRKEVKGVWESAFKDIIQWDGPQAVTSGFTLRLEVRAADFTVGELTNKWMLVDVGTIIRDAPAGANSGNNIRDLIVAL